MDEDVERLLGELPSKLEPFKDPENQTVRELFEAALAAIDADVENSKDYKKWAERRIRIGQINWDKFGDVYIQNRMMR